MAFIEFCLIAENIYLLLYLVSASGRSLNQLMNEEYMPNRSAY